MLLLTEPFAELASPADALSAALVEDRHQEALALFETLVREDTIGGTLTVWADLIALVQPSGKDAFVEVGQKVPHGAWLPHAVALVDAVSDLSRVQQAGQKAFQELRGENRERLFAGLAVGARSVLDLAGGMQRLLDCAALHHSCAGPQFTDPARARLVSVAAWVIAAYAASEHEAANERAATLVGSGPYALEMLIALWLQVTSAVTRGGEKLLIEVDARDGMPQAVVDPTSAHPALPAVRLIQAAVNALQRQDRTALDDATRRIAALSDEAKTDLVLQLARSLAASVGPRLGEPL
ncbi:hypothetical protein [Streptomyces sp. NPDC087294]|uniref:hypothetical protein n=1 Tax=Streptomyces sp. NPDC087294 TaxID=3365777 RepID=UPI0037FBCC05